MGAIRPQTPNQDVGWSQWRDGSAVRFYKLPTLHLSASPSHCSWSLDPISLAHRIQDRTQAGQLQ